MVSNENATVNISVITTQANAEIQDFKNKVNQVGSLWQRTKMTILSESRQTLARIQGLFNVMKSVLDAAGISFGTLGDGLLAMIGSVITSAVAIQAGWAASGPVGWAMMGISAFALGISLAAEVKVIAGIDEARAEAAKSRAVMDSLSAALGTWV